jgi:hypothetical protein
MEPTMLLSSLLSVFSLYPCLFLFLSFFISLSSYFVEILTCHKESHSRKPAAAATATGSRLTMLWPVSQGWLQKKYGQGIRLGARLDGD